VVVSWLFVDCFVVIESVFRGCLVVFDRSSVVVGWLWSGYLLLFGDCLLFVRKLFRGRWVNI